MNDGQVIEAPPLLSEQDWIILGVMLGVAAVIGLLALGLSWYIRAPAARRFYAVLVVERGKSYHDVLDKKTLGLFHMTFIPGALEQRVQVLKGGFRSREQAEAWLKRKHPAGYQDYLVKRKPGIFRKHPEPPPRAADSGAVTET